VTSRTPPICDYCGNPARLLTSSAGLYRGVDYGPTWYCANGHEAAWVGCHRDSKDHAPLGRLANAELRQAKQDAHRVFDRLWRQKMRSGATKHIARNAAYAWLAQQLGIPQRDCHIGMFDLEQCRRVVDICTPPWRKAA
jgi:hypothetical protein